MSGNRNISDKNKLLLQNVGNRKKSLTIRMSVAHSEAEETNTNCFAADLLIDFRHLRLRKQSKNEITFRITGLILLLYNIIGKNFHFITTIMQAMRKRLKTLCQLSIFTCVCMAAKELIVASIQQLCRNKSLLPTCSHPKYMQHCISLS